MRPQQARQPHSRRERRKPGQQLLITTELGVTLEERVFSIHCPSEGILRSENRAVLSPWKPDSWVPLQVGRGRGGAGDPRTHPQR